MKYDDLKEDEYIKMWVSASKMAINSQKTYLRGMHYYTEFTGMSPEELIKEANREVREGLLPSERSITRPLT